MTVASAGCTCQIRFVIRLGCDGEILHEISSAESGMCQLRTPEGRCATRVWLTVLERDELRNQFVRFVVLVCKPNSLAKAKSPRPSPFGWRVNDDDPTSKVPPAAT